MIRDPPRVIGMIVDSEKAETCVSQSDLGKIQGIRISKGYKREAWSFLKAGNIVSKSLDVGTQSWLKNQEINQWGSGAEYWWQLWEMRLAK